MLPIEEILFAPIDEERETTPNEATQIENECAPSVEPQAEQAEVEIYPEKPRDENSDIVPNTNLTEEEIAQLILDEEEVLNEKGVLGVNFKKLRPRAPLFKQSQVFKELQEEENEDPAKAEERKLRSTFLQKPERPIPKPRPEPEATAEPEVEPYRVVIKKQPKRSITKRLVEQGLLEASRAARVPEPAAEVNERHPARDPSPAPSLEVEEAHTECEELALAPTPVLEAVEAPPQTTSPPDREELPQAPLPTVEAEQAPPSDPEMPPQEMTLPLAREELAPASVPPPTATPGKPRPRLCRRGRYARRCLGRALDSVRGALRKAPAPAGPRLPRRGRYLERILAETARLAGVSRECAVMPCPPAEEGFLRLVMLVGLAHSLRDTYDAEILHRGSSRRGSTRRPSSAGCGSRRESSAELEPAAYLALGRKGSSSFQTKCAEGRRRLSVISTMVADKVGHAMRTDLARGLAYAMVPCASALAFCVYSYAKRFHSGGE